MQIIVENPLQCPAINTTQLLKLPFHIYRTNQFINLLLRLNISINISNNHGQFGIELLCLTIFCTEYMHCKCNNYLQKCVKLKVNKYYYNHQDFIIHMKSETRSDCKMLTIFDTSKLMFIFSANQITYSETMV